MTDAPPFRNLRLGVALSLREVARRSGVAAWRLSLIERGMPPTDQERAAIMAELAKAIEGLRA